MSCLTLIKISFLKLQGLKLTKIIRGAAVTHLLMKKNKEGIKRGAKEKSYEAKKHPVTVYITGEQINNLGGIEKCRELSLKSLTNQ